MRERSGIGWSTTAVLSREITMSKQGEAGSGNHTPRKGETPQQPGTKHKDTGEHAKRDTPVHKDTVHDAKGTAKYPD